MQLPIHRLIGAAALTACLAAAGCATSPGYANDGYYGAAAPTGACYNDCGTVTRIEVVSGGGSGLPNATGAVVGAVVGAAAGRELADDESKGRQNTATAVGAVAGALAGNAIQNRVQGDGTYRVTVRLDDGRTTVVTQNDLGGIREGSYVRVYNGRAWAR
jgi:outer membrane lipoprotein SlyB